MILSSTRACARTHTHTHTEKKIYSAACMKFLDLNGVWFSDSIAPDLRETK
jgi:hypothetical protein